MKAEAAQDTSREGLDTAPLLSVVVPFYNQPDILDNARTIRERIAEGLGGDVEMIVVSDGSSRRPTRR